MATAICSPSLAPILPVPSARNEPHMLSRAAGEFATALNMFGTTPKAPLIWSKAGFTAAFAEAGSTRFTRAIMLVSFSAWGGSWGGPAMAVVGPHLVRHLLSAPEPRGRAGSDCPRQL